MQKPTVDFTLPSPSTVDVANLACDITLADLTI